MVDEASARDCDHGFGCTADACDEEAAACASTPDHEGCPDAPDGRPGLCAPGSAGADEQGCRFAEPRGDSAECDDHLWCTGEEHCLDGYCQPGEPMECHDGIGCTDDLCDELTAGCVYQTRHTFRPTVLLS